ncbi:basic helix-loop-helix (bHLH) DNA-binding superfamily protein [Euphorbia peplus]|nr:basic helix-loop-helix (bHLH) DNA-binding superfamily protein [Euphorbia peplus]
MYEESASFDPNSMVEAPDEALSQVLQQQQQPLATLMAGGSSTDSHNNNNTFDELSYHHNNETLVEMHNQILAFNNSDHSSYVPTQPDLLNLFNLPRCSSSLMPNSSISFTNPNPNFAGDIHMGDTSSGSSMVYDPLLYLNLPPQPPLIRDLFQNNGFAMPGGCLFGVGVDDNVDGAGGGGMGEQQYDNGGVLDFSWDPRCVRKGRKGSKVTKHFATERQRRQQINHKYDALKDLIPVRTKDDRASVVADAIQYIKELMATVNDLKMLVEKKRCAKERRKRVKTEADHNQQGSTDANTNNGQEELSSSCVIKAEADVVDQQSFNNNGSLRSSCLQRKSKDTEVDVRIIDDEVTIKLVQRKRINCLLSVSKVLHELQLDLHHVAGGHVGDYYSFLFNTKIYEGSSIYASAIANKVIEVVDTLYASAAAASSSSGGCYYHMSDLSVDGR